MPRLANSTKILRSIERLRSLTIDLLGYDVQITFIPLKPPEPRKTRKARKEEEDQPPKYDLTVLD